MRTDCILLIVILGMILAGCETLAPSGTGRATLAAATGDPGAQDVLPAVIVEIDGERVSIDRERYVLDPGLHSIRVWPRQPGARGYTRAFGASYKNDVTIGALEIDVRAGERVHLAAVVRRTRVYFESGDYKAPLGPWKTTVLPVVVRRF